jgi:3-hydroxyisobutyrate dehydrogenase/2-hydroxy-3-oxopropionate reductase
MTAVAVIGLGAMGSRIAMRLLDAHHSVIVWNRTPGRAEQLVGRGAVAATNPADAARRAEVVITMVSDPQALRDVTEGEDGVAAGAGPSVTVIEMSTVGLEAVERLAEALPQDAHLIDAPVLGSVSEAESGSLMVFLGGPREIAERWTPLLSVLGSVTDLGPLGAGAAAKLVANTTLFGVLGVLGEAIALGRGLGLGREAIFEVLATTPLAAQAERRRAAIEQDVYPRRFALGLARKDLGLIAEAAAASRVDLRLCNAAMTWFDDADEAGWGDRDYSAVLAHIADSRRNEKN